MRRIISGVLSMANDEPVRLLKQGVEAWNAWRAENPDVRPDLRWAHLFEADLTGANLSWANLSWANLSGLDLRWAHLIGANLNEANLEKANLVETDLTGADLTGCHICGVSAWGLRLSEGTIQQDLIITSKNEPQITTDDIEVAQFLYLSRTTS